MSTSSSLETDEELDVNNSDVDSIAEVDVDVTSLLDNDQDLREQSKRVNITRKRGIESLTELVSERALDPPLKRTRGDYECSDIPKEDLKDFAGYSEAVKEVERLLSHVRQVDIYSKLGVTPPRGLLVHGPHGSGKTLLVRAVAGHLRLPLFIVSGSDLLSYCAHVRIRAVFELATQKSPSVAFLDGLEAVEERKDVGKYLAAALDDLELGIMVVGTTSSPENLDPALRATGRFDREVGLGVPNLQDRQAILEHLTAGIKLEKGLSAADLAERTPGWLGGDLKALISETGVSAVDRAMSEGVESQLTDDEISNLYVTRMDFLSALKRVQPSSKRQGFVSIPEVTWDDVGSLSSVRRQLETSILLPVTHPEMFESLGIERPAGILLCGPPGCGKTLVAKAIANEAKINFLAVKGPELLSMYVGESERGVRQCFRRAMACRPCVLFVDEIDSLCPRRYGAGEGSNITARVVNQFLTEMDGVEDRRGVFLLATTNRPDLLDPALLRPGRLDVMVWVDLPSVMDRADILRALTRRVPLGDVDLEEIARDPRLNGFSGADLSALVKEACVIALKEHLAKKTSRVALSSDILLKTASTLRPSVTDRDLSFYKNLKASLGGKNGTCRYGGVSQNTG